MDIFFLKGLNIFSSIFCVCADDGFKAPSLPVPWTFINFSLAFFENYFLDTDFDNSYWNPLQNPLFCDWSMFCSAYLSLAAEKMRNN